MKIKTIQQQFKKDYQETNDWKVTYQRFLDHIQKKEENETITFSGLVKEIALPLFLHLLIVEKMPINQFRKVVAELYKEDDAHIILSHCFNIEMSYDLDEAFLPRLKYASSEEKQEVIHLMLAMSNIFSNDDGELIKENIPYLQACLELIPDSNPNIFFNSKLILFMSQFTSSEKIKEALPIFSSVEKNTVFKERRDVSALNFGEGFMNNLISNIIGNTEEIKKFTHILDKFQFEENLMSLLENATISERDVILFCSDANINYFPGLEKRWSKTLNKDLSKTNSSESYYYNKIVVWMHNINKLLQSLEINLSEENIDYSRWSLAGDVIENMPQLFLYYYAIKNGEHPQLSILQSEKLSKLVEDYLQDNQLCEETTNYLDARLIQSYLQLTHLNSILSSPETIESRPKI